MISSPKQCLHLRVRTWFVRNWPCGSWSAIRAWTLKAGLLWLPAPFSLRAAHGRRCVDSSAWTPMAPPMRGLQWWTSAASHPTCLACRPRLFLCQLLCVDSYAWTATAPYACTLLRGLYALLHGLICVVSSYACSLLRGLQCAVAWAPICCCEDSCAWTPLCELLSAPSLADKAPA